MVILGCEWLTKCIAGSLGFTVEPVKQHDRAIYLDMQVGIKSKLIH